MMEFERLLDMFAEMNATSPLTDCFQIGLKNVIFILAVENALPEFVNNSIPIHSRNYQLTIVPNFAEMPMGLMFRYKSDLVEQFNVIIAERIPFLSGYLKTRAFYNQDCQ
jgi:hypothetical protein